MKYEEMYLTAEENNALVDLVPQYFEFKQAGDRIVGKHITNHLVKEDGQTNNYRQYIFETDYGMVKFHMGSCADKEVGAKFELNQVYAILFQGKENIGGGKSVNKFKVMLLKNQDGFEIDG